MSDPNLAGWLAQLGLQAYEETFRAQDIDLDVLPDLDLAELRELGVSLGDAKRIQRAARELGAAAEPGTPAETDAERRQVTVAFCDLVGSTALSETLDPEDLRDILESYYRRCGEVARRFGGDVAKVVGDGVDLYFGYPHAFEKSALAAVEAALDVVAAVAELSAGRAAGIPELEVRVGVHTGLAVVSGAGASVDAVGDVPVIAERIKTAAQPGSIVLSEATAQLVSADLDVEDLGPHELKGLSAPIRLYTVSGASTRAGLVAETRAAKGIVGREAELASLQARWLLAADGNGQVVVLTGEAGIGKSRVIQALAASAAGAPRVLRFQCSPYRTGAPLWPVVEHLRRSAGMRLDDREETRLERLQRLVESGSGSIADDAVPVLASLLAIDYERRYPPLALAPEQLRERTLAVVLEYLGITEPARPGIVLFEDAHWADPTSHELLASAVERSQESPLLFVVTCRPDLELSWLAYEHPHVATVRLGRLAERHVRAIVDRVAQGKALPATVVERILDRTDGVPLFVEELTRTVLESTVLVDEGAGYALAEPLLDSAIPSTLRDSLATRLDRLGPVKEIAQIASVIGREFSYQLLAEVSGADPDEFASSLELLERSGLILRRDGHSTGWYVFKHALVQNAAYDSMLRSRRRALHEQIAMALQKRPGVADQQPELVAHHLDQAGLVERAIDAWVRTGDHATAGAHHEEALAHYRRALELLATLPASAERTERELDVHASLRNALIVLRGYSSNEVGDACAVALELCEELGATERSFPVLWNLTGFHMVRGEHAVCTGINERLLEIAAATADPELELMARDTVGQTLFYQGRFEEAVEQLSRVRDLYDPNAHRHLARTYAEEDPGAAARGYGSVALWALGHRDAALVWVREAVDLAEALPYYSTRGLVMSIVVHLAYCRGDPESARSAAATMRELAEEHGLGYYIPSAQVQQGWVLAAEGDAAAGIALMEEGIAGFERAGALLEQPFMALLLADGLLRGGRSADAVSALDGMLGLVERTGERCFESELLRARGEARAALGEAEDIVEADLCRALRLAAERRARSFRLRAAAALVRFRLDRGLATETDTLAGALEDLDGGLDEQDATAGRALLAHLEPV